MTRPSCIARLSLPVAAGAFLALAAMPHPVAAQGFNDIVRNLNSVLNPGDARRLEDQARQNNRPDEERYWHDYGAGLNSNGRPGDARSGDGRPYDNRPYDDRRPSDGRARPDDRRQSRLDPGDERTFRSDAAISLELSRRGRDAQQRYQYMSPGERQRFGDDLSRDARGRYERMTDSERQRYLDDLNSEQRRLDSSRR